MTTTEFQTELVPIEELKPHPRNYREHPKDQLEHICASIKQNGLYRNVVVAKDLTILAGHGVVLACKELGFKKIPVLRLNIDPKSSGALKVLAGDNEITHLGVIDDRALSEILKEIQDIDINKLVGTGFDENMLATLVMVTRPESEIKDFNEAAEWAGMPEYQDEGEQIKLVISFDVAEARKDFVEQLKIQHARRGDKIWTCRWPDRPSNDLKSVKFEAQ